MLAVGVLTGCASATALPPATTEPLPPTEVRVDADRGAAYDRTVAALVESGYTVAEGNRESGTLATLPFPGESVVASSGLGVARARTDLRIRASIVPADGGSRVLLTLTGQGSISGGMTGTDTLPEAALRECPATAPASCRQELQRLQGLLRAVAARIQS